MGPGMREGVVEGSGMICPPCALLLCTQLPSIPRGRERPVLSCNHFWLLGQTDIKWRGEYWCPLALQRYITYIKCIYTYFSSFYNLDE